MVDLAVWESRYGYAWRLARVNNLSRRATEKRGCCRAGMLPGRQHPNFLVLSQKPARQVPLKPHNISPIKFKFLSNNTQISREFLMILLS